MLVQTQVARVVPKYEAFLERFPEPAACAAAPAGEVFTALGRVGLQPARPEPAPQRVRRRRATWWRGSRFARRAAGASRCWALHGPGGAGLRLRAGRGRGRHQRGAGAGALERSATRTSGGAGPRRRRRAGRGGLAVEPGRARPGRHGAASPGSLRATTARSAPAAVGPRRASPSVDPVVGTAGTGARQSRFEGSDRQGRGRLVDALRVGPVDLAPRNLATVMGWPDDPDRAERVTAGVIADGLAERAGRCLRLP